MMRLEVEHDQPPIYLCMKKLRIVPLSAQTQGDHLLLPLAGAFLRLKLELLLLQSGGTSPDRITSTHKGRAGSGDGRTEYQEWPTIRWKECIGDYDAGTNDPDRYQPVHGALKDDCSAT